MTFSRKILSTNTRNTINTATKDINKKGGRKTNIQFPSLIIILFRFVLMVSTVKTDKEKRKREKNLSFMSLFETFRKKEISFQADFRSLEYTSFFKLTVSAFSLPIGIFFCHFWFLCVINVLAVLKFNYKIPIATAIPSHQKIKIDVDCSWFPFFDFVLKYRFCRIPHHFQSIYLLIFVYRYFHVVFVDLENFRHRQIE